MRDAPKDMPFDGALWGLKRGARMTREAWGKPAPWVMLLKRASWDEFREFSADIAAVDIQPEPYFLQFTGGHAYVAWTPTTTDILANDWREYQP